jgi:glycosyltransferase involved in cell wall biosynthesis
MFDVFMCTSRWEPFGIAVLEAMAAEIPVVGFAVDGIREIVEKGGGAVLIEGRDYDTLARTVIRLLDDPQASRQLAAQGLANVKSNFDIRTNIKVLENVYTALVGPT